MKGYSIRHFTAKQVSEAGYTGKHGGSVKGAHYAIYKEGAGLVSLDGGRTVYMLTGTTGRNVLESLIKFDGIYGDIDYMETL